MCDDNYKTIRSAITFEMKEKGSRFICRARPVRSRDEAEFFIAQIAKQHFDASHNCYAYAVGCGAHEMTRFSDDGEPSGTAGKPILLAIQGRDLTNVAVVVTRYFGGVKLGTGGLIRAYGGVTSEVLDRAQHHTLYIKDKLALACTYHQLNSIMSFVEKFGGQISSSDYGEQIDLIIELRRSLSEKFIDFVFDKTAGQVKPRMVP